MPRSQPLADNHSTDDDLHARIRQLESMVLTLTQDQPRHREPKVADPEFFFGEGRKLRNFIAQCRLNFKTQPSRFPTEQLKVNYAMSFLRDKAFTRFEPLLNKDSPPELDNFESFVKVLESNFGDPDPEATAIRQMCSLRQTTSVSAYAAEFRYLQQFIDWNDGAFRKQYYDGLKDIIKIELARSGHPTELGALIELTTQIDNRFTNLCLDVDPSLISQFYPKPSTKKQSQPYHRPGPAPAPVTPVARPNTVHAPRPVDPNAARPRFQPLTDAEKQYRRAHNLCLYCAKPDHAVIDCPSRPKQYKQNRPPASKIYGTSNQHSRQVTSAVPAQSEPLIQGKAPAQIR